MEENILLEILDQAAKKAISKVKKGQTITLDDAMPLLLKTLFRRVRHLDKQMVTRIEFEARCSKIEHSVEKVYKFLTLNLVIIGLMITVLTGYLTVLIKY